MSLFKKPMAFGSNALLSLACSVHRVATAQNKISLELINSTSENLAVPGDGVESLK